MGLATVTCDEFVHVMVKVGTTGSICLTVSDPVDLGTIANVAVLGRTVIGL